MIVKLLFKVKFTINSIESEKIRFATFDSIFHTYAKWRTTLPVTRITTIPFFLPSDLKKKFLSRNFLQGEGVFDVLITNIELVLYGSANP